MVQKKWTESRKNFRVCNHGHAYPEELEELPKIMTLQWLENALLAEERRGGMISKEEWEFSKGFNFKVMSFLHCNINLVHKYIYYQTIYIWNPWILFAL